jgi:hypothetical protein
MQAVSIYIDTSMNILSDFNNRQMTNGLRFDVYLANAFNKISYTDQTKETD